ncbi:hypothetical protein B296_00049568 [Ensete ventricosum]|uniref:Uncharacterized protein n=1 Tax=Ensete ventricosum TaxID=4639 RepID=A0A426YQ31_ENSVE|nr:hypothetical protein B296_00049568 [Ensete ventricosum]
MHAARNMKGRRGKDAEEEWKRKRGIAYFPSKPIVSEKEHVSVGLRFQSASETALIVDDVDSVGDAAVTESRKTSPSNSGLVNGLRKMAIGGAVAFPRGGEWPTDTTRTGIWSVATNGTVGAVEGPARKEDGEEAGGAEAVCYRRWSSTQRRPRLCSSAALQQWRARENDDHKKGFGHTHRLESLPSLTLIVRDM